MFRPFFKYKKAFILIAVIGLTIYIILLTGKQLHIPKVAFQRLGPNTLAHKWEIALTCFQPIKFDFDELSLSGDSAKRKMYLRSASKYIYGNKIIIHLPEWINKDMWGNAWGNFLSKIERQRVYNSIVISLKTLKWERDTMDTNLIYAEFDNNDINKVILVNEILSEICILDSARNFVPFYIDSAHRAVDKDMVKLTLNSHSSMAKNYSGFDNLIFYRSKLKDVLKDVSDGRALIAVKEGVQMLNNNSHSSIQIDSLLASTNYYAYITGDVTPEQAYYIYENILLKAVRKLEDSSDIYINDCWLPNAWPYWDAQWKGNKKAIDIVRDKIETFRQALKEKLPNSSFPNTKIKIYYEPEIRDFIRFIKNVSPNIINGGEIEGNPLGNSKFSKDATKENMIVVYIYGSYFDGQNGFPPHILVNTFWYNSRKSPKLRELIDSELIDSIDQKLSSFSDRFLTHNDISDSFVRSISEIERIMEGITANDRKVFIYPLFGTPIKIIYNKEKVSGIEINYKRGFIKLHIIK